MLLLSLDFLFSQLKLEIYYMVAMCIQCGASHIFKKFQAYKNNSIFWKQKAHKLEFQEFSHQLVFGCRKDRQT
jgi:hypothetical protein